MFGTRAFGFRVVPRALSYRRLMQSINIMDERHVAGDIGAACSEIARLEVSLGLEIGKPLVQAVLDLRREKDPKFADRSCRHRLVR